MKIISPFSILFLMFCLTFGQTQPVTANTTWFVSPDGSGYDCTQANPCQLDDAVQTKSNAGDTILAKEGIYRDTGSEHPYLTYIYKSLTLIGSCSFEATGPVTCVPSLMNSFLDGELERRVIIVQGNQGDGMNVSISGFTIMRGNGGNNPVGTCIESPGEIVLGCGGGIFAENVDNLILTNNDLWINRGSNSTASLQSTRGGGIYAEKVGYLFMKGNKLRYNQAGMEGQGYGGGIFMIDSGVASGILITNNLFEGNELTTNQITGIGAGICAIESNHIQINDNVFTHQNYLQQTDIDGSAIYLLGVGNSYIYTNSFHHNYGRSSIRVIDMGTAETVVVVNRNKLTDEETTERISIKGGAEVIVMNNFIGNNNMLSNLIGIYTEGTDTYGYPNVFIEFNSFALIDYGLYIDNHSQITASNNIFTLINDTAIYDNDPSTTTLMIDRNLFHSNTNDGIRGSVYFTGDPLLVDPSDGDFHIQAGSAAIDKVNLWQGGIDIDGQVRGIGTLPDSFDVGADEYMLVNYLPLIIRFLEN